MSIAELIAAFNTAAMVLGYVVLTLLFTAAMVLGNFWLEKLRYARRRQRKNDIEWDNIRSKWLDTYIPIERNRNFVVDPDRVKTAEFEFPLDQVYDYLKEQDRDAS